jgi:hypothetical protein
MIQRMVDPLPDTEEGNISLCSSTVLAPWIDSYPFRLFTPVQRSLALSGTFQLSFTPGKRYASRLNYETDSQPANSQPLQADLTWADL